MHMSAIVGAKDFEFFTIMVCPYGQGKGVGEVEPVRTFCGQRKGVDLL